MNLKKPYVIEYGPHSLIIDPYVVQLFSKKFEALFKQFREKLVIEETYSFRVFMNFMAAAQKWTIEPPSYLLPELFEISNEWEAPELADYFGGLLAEVSSIDSGSAVNQLVEATKANGDLGEEIRRVALVLDKALENPRLNEIPMYIMYQVIDRAEEQGFDSGKLIPYTLNLFRTNPAAAMPLILRIDFNKLTEEEYAEMFCQRDIHTQNVNFFAAAAMSAINKNANNQIQIFKKTFDAIKAESGKLNDPEEFDINQEPEKEDLDVQKRPKIVEEMESLIERDFEDIGEKINNNEKSVIELGRAIEAQRIRLKQAIMNSNSARSNEELLKEAQVRLRTVLEQKKEEIKRIIIDDKNAEKDVLDEMLDKAREELSSKMKDLPKEITDEIEQETATLDRQKGTLMGVKDRLKKARSLMAAKIIRDKLRTDEFLRKTERRFEVFAPGNEFLQDITPETVKAAEETIIEIEEKLENACPIIGKPNPA